MFTNQTERISFASAKNTPNYPDFLDIQIKSFQDFFQLETKSDERGNEGLYNTFMENFPITDTRNQFVLEFLDYFIDPPRYSIQECIERGLTYSVPLKARLKLYCTDPEHEDFETIVQDVYLGTIPYMTPSGTFVINGAERVVVSQLHRSPGVFFGQSFHANGTKLYSARVIPFKGSWIEFATDINGVMYAYIDRKKKLPVTTLFRAIGFERDKDILEIFDLSEEVKVSNAGLKKVLGRKLAARVLNTWHEDFVDEDTGEVVSIERNEIILDRDTILEKDHINEILEADVKTILLHKENNAQSDYAIIHNTLQKDPTNSEKEAVEHIYRQLRNAEPPDEETARGIIDKLFFSDQRYNLGEVGRYRMNKKLGLDIGMDKQVLTKEDIITIIKYLIELINSKAEIDDIDHLSNRRVRTVGEQLSQQFGVGLARMARTIRERMNVRDNEVFTPIDLINAKTLSSVINSFFGTNQLSQFMDQTNPLAEITHKRRLSALGPGGLSRERAGFEVRDVHYTHYGRLCPIETPEGPNIGLISSLSVFAKVNPMGFLETPYRKVDNGTVNINDFTYLSAEEEEGMKIAQANIPMDEKGTITAEKVIAREEGDFPVVDPAEIQYTDVAPNQIASISASLIPFLEHDDANRALMGSNMMRQAVPLLKPESPIVGTGLERQVASDSRVLINAEGDGVIEYVDSQKITIKYDRTEEQRLVSFEEDSKTYELVKFRKTNQGTSINLKPIVKKGYKVKKGQVLCEGYATESGELALGRNLVVAFMPWKGYNFEDAIVISEKVVREDIFTSIHVDEYALEVRDTKLGAEELTNDIPNVSEEATKDLDEYGMIRIGAEVKPGDILIGKITPKGESDPTPEEKLLRAIFGDKAGDVKDASLKASPSLRGVVIDKKLFSRSVKDKRKRSEDKEELSKLELEYEVKFQQLKDVLVEKLFTLVNGKTSQGVLNDLGEEVLPKGKKYTMKMLNAVDDFAHLVGGSWTTDKESNTMVTDLLHNYKIKLNDLQGNLRRDKFTISVGDELPAGIMKLAKVYIAKKRKLKVGDKMAGRHGNKGIVSRIVRHEDMPFLEDGTPVDIVLNPLGVPSRMNIGQIYETVLGWAGLKLGKKYATPIFDGATLDEINAYTDEAGIPRFGHTYLHDGGTGQRFDQPATVGVIYMLKLGHMVDDKMHARSIGPYSLITQQPLGGKAQFGGQRFGEMEVWALEAYGASATLREILTVKSDDVIGRAKTYEAIVKGETMPEPGLPESFNVLMHELKGLGLDIRLEE
ncbi:DNA-directed RNA polymerase subunit beta [Arenibacter algicola]|jgi:DNA-directed RNA polymerase subunit beta|uniref:DNA-directed RNA polymerase subunit beta n=1 Tax=Arenibacter algicola TaxID=616991 RepID=A0A221UQ63_9FLAO|nr:MULTISPECIES: DNA-directed RNA polymerase subunit beta [Arenibacter]ASO03509.1 DNA-directed RNA polymerase subunit beta [Arenibacter algicola]MBU2906174.1 DNA-directed RNA polymerase subunit beta [Arenibacter algicola]MCK0136305.1 DNA-directed RNA polymerase subunit beta [Arenibacter sp. S6351L]GBF18610.1 DNA-directed RNA polymerase subunit beta [Arenibacter sp. NBRC 103722]|tara:strand:+ start:4804 stop:8613 length:3810 start_codon:yes stop_codon:yes gene_type:complete